MSKLLFTKLQRCVVCLLLLFLKFPFEKSSENETQCNNANDFQGINILRFKFCKKLKLSFEGKFVQIIFVFFQKGKSNRPMI